jgi:hypothetical protein
MQCILCKIYFWKVFHKHYNFICTPICTKFLFLQKVGVTVINPWLTWSSRHACVTLDGVQLCYAIAEEGRRSNALYAPEIFPLFLDLSLSLFRHREGDKEVIGGNARGHSCAQGWPPVL